jgi:ribosomal protein L12E/L44/L45/RPP1/RPP2
MGLTAEQISGFKEAFDHFDADGSGCIDAGELQTVLEEFGQQVSQEELDAMIAEVDEDNNGEIDYDEFIQMMSVYADKAANSGELSAPDAPMVKAKLADRIADAKQEVLERVESILLNEVRENSARAIRTESGKSFFEQELEKGVVSVLQELSASFDNLQGSMGMILDLKDQKQSAAVTATRAKSFVEAANGISLPSCLSSLPIPNRSLTPLPYPQL